MYRDLQIGAGLVLPLRRPSVSDLLDWGQRVQEKDFYTELQRETLRY
jgi:hypothetical protein